MEEHQKSQDQLSTAQKQDACVKREPAQESLSINDNTETLFYPITDENWESRLPSFDIANPTNHKGEASAPIASGVYYSQISSEDKTTEETKTIEQHQQADIPAQAPADYVPMVQVFEIEPYTEAHWYPLDVVCRTFREQGRYWDLECLLDGSRGIRPEDRQIIYLWTLQAYADAGMFDRAVALSGQLHLEGLGVNFPAYHQLMSSFAAAQQSFAPTLPYSSYAYQSEPQPTASPYVAFSDYIQTDTSSQTGLTATPSDVSLVSSPRSSCPPTPGPQSVEESHGTPSERKVSAAAANSVAQHLQRRFKRALSDKNLEECLSSYYQLEKLNAKRGYSDPNANYNKTTINVTDSSSLIEFLVKDNRVHEATNVTEST